MSARSRPGGRTAGSSTRAPATTRWHRLPGSQRLVVHPDTGRRAGAVRSLSGTADWRRRVVDGAGVTALRLVGARRLPAAPTPPWPALPLDELQAVLAGELPGLRLLGAVVPRQPDRRRLSLLGRMTGNHVVVKLGDNDDVRRESEALALLSAHPLPGISTPEVVAAGRIDLSPGGVDYLATTAVAVHGQHAAIDEPLRTFESDLADRLAGLDRPAGTRPDAVPVHGDLTPWNLRRTSRGLALFDWESAGWGAPGSDLATYRAACDEVRPWWTRRPTLRTSTAGNGASR